MKCSSHFEWNYKYSFPQSCLNKVYVLSFNWRFELLDQNHPRHYYTYGIGNHFQTRIITLAEGRQQWNLGFTDGWNGESLLNGRRSSLLGALISQRYWGEQCNFSIQWCLEASINPNRFLNDFQTKKRCNFCLNASSRLNRRIERPILQPNPCSIADIWFNI